MPGSVKFHGYPNVSYGDFQIHSSPAVPTYKSSKASHSAIDNVYAILHN